MAKARKKDRTKQILFLIIICFIIGVVCFFVYKRMHAEQIDITKGNQIMQQMESADVAEIEAEIRQLHPIVISEDGTVDGVPLLEHFRDCVIMGDSVASEMAEYHILNESVVVADIGMTLPNTEAEVEKTVRLNPKKVFLSYGLNDVTSNRGDTEKFKKDYKALLNTLRERLPGVELYIVSVTPVQEKAMTPEYYYSEINNYDTALQELCEEEGIVFIDTRDLIQDDMYEQDGIHFKPEYYENWAKRMIEVAGL